MDFQLSPVEEQLDYLKFPLLSLNFFLIFYLTAV